MLGSPPGQERRNTKKAQATQYHQPCLMRHPPLSPTCGVSYNKAHTPGIPVYRKPSPCILSCRRLSHCRAARQAPCDSENVTWLSEKRYVVSPALPCDSENVTWLSEKRYVVSPALFSYYVIC